MRGRRRIVLALSFCCASLLSSVASVHAAPEPPDEVRRRARALADGGADAYAARDFARAHDRFVRAYALVPAPTIALFEARALVELGRWLAARRAYERAASAVLPADAPAAFRAAARDARDELAALEVRLPRYRVEVSAPGELRSLSVSVDGVPVPQASLAAWTLADPGVHELAVRDGDGPPNTTRFELRERDRKTLRIDQPSSNDPARTWAMISLGAGAAGVALGITAGIVAVDAHADAERLCPERTCARGSAGAGAVQRFESYRTVSTLGYALGAAGLGTGVVLLAFGTSEAKPEVALLSGFRTLELRGRF